MKVEMDKLKEEEYTLNLRIEEDELRHEVVKRSKQVSRMQRSGIDTIKHHTQHKSKIYVTCNM